MHNTRTIACSLLVLLALFTGNVSLFAQANLIHPQPTIPLRRILLRSNQSFTAIHPIISLRTAASPTSWEVFDRGERSSSNRHIEIAQMIFRGTMVKTSIAKLRFVRPDVAIVDISGEMTGFAKVPQGLPVGSDGILRFKLLEVLTKEKGEWWITEYHNVAVTPEL